ncbi:hypothetical protein AVEN_203108-1 [Araneus ventricosus]|uniref:Uncharacterized protein n=1 Tax=Araneus ventricosus TaxID=182803 RepID=A0A4Y2DPT5_ARAVE|nr:hypothetical protein AVEN_203108-1 [Araneus ventricosus]
MRPAFPWTSHFILYTTFSMAESNVHQKWSAQTVICCPSRSLTSRPHQGRPWTSNNPTGKSRMRLDPRRMDMENVVCMMQCVVNEKGDNIEGSSHAPDEEVILLNKELWCTAISSL